VGWILQAEGVSIPMQGLSKCKGQIMLPSCLIRTLHAGFLILEPRNLPVVSYDQLSLRAKVKQVFQKWVRNVPQVKTGQIAGTRAGECRLLDG